MGGVYITGQEQVRKSVDQLEMVFSSFKVEGLSLIPPRIDLTLTYTVNNPSEIPLKVSVEGRLLYGDTLVSPIIILDQEISARGMREVEMHVSLNGSLLEAIGDPENERGYRLEGKLIVEGLYLGLIPVKVDMDLAEISDSN